MWWTFDSTPRSLWAFNSRMESHLVNRNSYDFSISCIDFQEKYLLQMSYEVDILCDLFNNNIFLFAVRSAHSKLLNIDIVCFQQIQCIDIVRKLCVNKSHPHHTDSYKIVEKQFAKKYWTCLYMEIAKAHSAQYICVSRDGHRNWFFILDLYFQFVICFWISSGNFISMFFSSTFFLGKVIELKRKQDG